MPASDYVRNLRARVGPELIMFPTVSAIVLNDLGEVLLHQRSDTGQWALIAGMMDPGEQPADAVLREVEEETAVRVTIERLAGVLSHDVTYPNGDHCQMVNMFFRCRAIAGEARVNDTESLAVGWYPVDAMPDISPFAQKLLSVALDDNAPPYFATPGEGRS
ncbi:NUDIX hydrolase [Actinoplanes palleronii]|uniref:NUDIX hydrolase n=1 Tax=Actinoplanes palleronii TaxID=113570 RepID=A0ABQ4BD55_9ACTN|nr:NUDIX domain-containing protein [Actinoplanes palleronii]GIE68601.1 NUDIX hydrolase [Actinoplanes palleronii]